MSKACCITNKMYIIKHVSISLARWYGIAQRYAMILTNKWSFIVMAGFADGFDGNICGKTRFCIPLLSDFRLQTLCHHQFLEYQIINCNDWWIRLILLDVVVVVVVRPLPLSNRISQPVPTNTSSSQIYPPLSTNMFRSIMNHIIWPQSAIVIALNHHRSHHHQNAIMIHHHSHT